MTDKEVGELWRKIVEDCGPFDGCANHGDQIALIRKLVEERAAQWFAEIKLTQDSKDDTDWDIAKSKALADFGIKPEDWKP